MASSCDLIAPGNAKLLHPYVQGSVALCFRGNKEKFIEESIRSEGDLEICSLELTERLS